MSETKSSYRLLDSPATAQLFAEAERQLTICNSCRYCEGYCAVYPALKRRVVLIPGDITYLANLCHDCRACFYACMYALPHEFAVNPPAILSEIRRLTYDQFTITHWCHIARSRLGASRIGLAGLLFSISLVLVLALIGSDHGLGVLIHRSSPTGSPYAVLTYASIVVCSLVLLAAAGLAMVLGGLAYWRRTRGSLAGIADPRAWWHALGAGASLRYLRGGDEGCYVKENHPSRQRRALHALVAYGFLSCLISTIAAAIEEDLFAQPVPFPILSLPVLAGLFGGSGLIIGAAGLLWLRHTENCEPTDAPMTGRDRNFLVALVVLGATGLATLGLRDQSIYGLMLALHLAAVWCCFILAPFTKFVHFVYRLLALVQDNLELRAG